jgi:hypothetical protein
LGKFSRRIENTRKSSRQQNISGPVYSLQPSVLLVFLLVSGEQTFMANFAIPNERIEQMARKNDGASANPNTSTAAPSDRQGRVEPRQDFRRDRRRSLSLGHAGQ